MRFKIFTWKGFHKYVGVVMAVFLLVFCISGLILNHRKAFSSFNVSRSFLPSGYQIKNYNNGSVRGSVTLNDSLLLVYGNGGVWQCRNDFSEMEAMNSGLPEGADRRSVRNVVITKQGNLWCVTNYGVYKFLGAKWKMQALDCGEERLTDISLAPDSLGVVVMSRSHLYMPTEDGGYKTIELKAPDGYEPKYSLFKTVWMLHSGELFGNIGRIVVDGVAVILIILCLTSLVLFIWPYPIRYFHRKGKGEVSSLFANQYRKNLSWHKKTGYVTLVLTLLVTITGTCLRPPLMIPLAMNKVKPLPGSELSSPNPWNDKLRALRWNVDGNYWLLSTSEGFAKVNATFDDEPSIIKNAAPVGPMGVNVFQRNADGTWLVGSFSGLYNWNVVDGVVTDAFTNKPYQKASGRPLADKLIVGYSQHTHKPTVFDYVDGASETLASQNEKFAEQPMSIWHVALELHVGRCYNSFLGPFSQLFVFFSGALIVLVLVSGYIRYRRTKKQHK